jgi:hypothetical protein
VNTGYLRDERCAGWQVAIDIEDKCTVLFLQGLKKQDSEERSKIWLQNLGKYHECRLLGCYAVWLLLTLTFKRNVLNVFIRSVLRLLVTANVVSSSPILVTLILQAIRSSETSVLTRATLRNIPEDGILHSYLSGNLKSYIALIGWAL